MNFSCVLPGLVYWKQRPAGASTGCFSSGDNNSMVLRNRMLCPYYGYGSEIVYPIAEHSDEPAHTVDSDDEPAGNTTASATGNIFNC